MSDKFRDDDDDDQLTRRRVLGAAAAATGIAAFAGSRISRSRVDNGEPTPSPNATATNSPVSSTPFVEASQESLASGTAIVTENGVDLSVGPVHVSAPAGVAAAGTGITVALGKHVPQGDVASLAAMIGDSADITLDGGIQPEQPLTVTFSLAGSPLASGVSDETPLMVLSWSESEEMYSLIEASWDAERETLTATVDHLSLHWPFKIDLQGIINGIVADLMGFRFPYPDCAYNPLTMGAATYTVAAIDDTSVWPCIEERNGEVVLSLHSNSILPWSIETTPSSRATITASFGDLSPALVGVYSGLYGLIGESRSAILPGNVATFTFAQNQPPTMARLVLEPGLFLITILVWAIRSLLEILLRGRAEAIADAMGQLDCLVDVINTTQEVTDELYFTGVINTAIICIKEAIVEEGGNWVAKAVTRTALAVVALVAGGAGLLAAAVLGIIKTVTSTDRITFQITSSLPAGQPEPSTVASGEGVLMYRGDTARSGHMPGPGPSLEKPIVVRWRTSSAGWIRSQPAILGDTLYAGNSDGQLCAVDSRSGTVLWRYRTDDSISATPAIANGVLYMGSRDHNLYAIDLETRAELWTFSTTGPVDSAPTALSLIHI